MKRPTKKQLDEMLNTGRLACDGFNDASELDTALAVARSCIESKRDIPTNVVMRCIAHARHWKGRDIPDAVVEARKAWLRAREAKQLAAKLQGEEA